jgi:hypothetical protein
MEGREGLSYRAPGAVGAASLSQKVTAQMSTPRASVLLAASASLAIGCSDAVPPAAEGAYSAAFVQSGSMCSIATHQDAVGAADAENYGLVKDGTPLTDVTCIVLDDGGSFYAEGFISDQDGARSLKFAVGGLTQGATEDDPALGSVAFRSKATLKTFSSPVNTCRFWFIPGSRQQVAAGRLWVTFECDVVESEGRQCRLGDATRKNTVALQNCDQ